MLSNPEMIVNKLNKNSINILRPLKTIHATDLVGKSSQAYERVRLSGQFASLSRGGILFRIRVTLIS